MRLERPIRVCPHLLFGVVAHLAVHARRRRRVGRVLAHGTAQTVALADHQKLLSDVFVPASFSEEEAGEMVQQVFTGLKPIKVIILTIR